MDILVEALLDYYYLGALLVYCNHHTEVAQVVEHHTVAAQDVGHHIVAVKLGDHRSVTVQVGGYQTVAVHAVVLHTAPA